MRKTSPLLSVMLLSLVFGGLVQAQGDAHWPQWRGPFFNGMARGDAPTVWSDTKNIKWKVEIPGRGFSTPVIWGDKIFLTTAVPSGKAPEQPQAAPSPEGRRAGGGAGPLVEHKFEVLCLDRKTGKYLGHKETTFQNVWDKFDPQTGTPTYRADIIDHEVGQWIDSCPSTEA